jgi:phosphoribosylformylglycinamidine cyclo-ligase
VERNRYEVDIDLANKTKAEMAAALEAADPRVLNRLGAFASLYDIRMPEYRHPVLVMKTEEPGSKQLLAFSRGKVEGVCRDMIHHLINDCIVMGARPLIVQDAIICGKLEKEIVNRVVNEISRCCRENGCSLTGGETSEQPGVLPAGSYILTSSIVGIVEKDQIIDGSRIEEGDVLVGLESSGLHTNGYTLVRRLMSEDPAIADEPIDGISFIDRVLEPHRCYYQGLRELFPTGKLRGLAHITGGGIKENLNRILPEGLDAKVHLGRYRLSSLFRFLKEAGKLSDAEMLRTFNMGIGLVAATRPADAAAVIGHLGERGFPAFAIGEVVRGSGQVLTVGEFPW